MAINISYLAIRRELERIAALVVLIIFSPLLLIASALIALDGGPVFFRQVRIGKDAREFQIFKLRSMIVDADKYLDENGVPTRDRITKIGHFIRKTSIDELPQFLNVARGEMGIIGPRPILPFFLPYMTQEEKRRFQVLPGITGWAQVNGRNHVKWSKRFQMDVYYVDHVGIKLDFRILLRTVWTVFFERNIAMDRNISDMNDITLRTLEND